MRRRCLKTAEPIAVARFERGDAGSAAAGSAPLHALQRIGSHADADGVRRRQSEGAALLSRRSARGRRRSAGRAVRRPRRATAEQDHRSLPAEARRRLHPEHAQVPAARKSQSAARRARQLPAAILERQLELIQPEFICCLGAVASQNLLGTTVSIGKLRGKFHTYRGAKVVCTYHPA